MICTLFVIEHKNWAYDIRTLLSKLGLLEIWHKQEIDRTLLAILKQRIYYQAKQEIYAYIQVFDLWF